jgi:glycosyltransferase involved in cell wall biosynthesis
MNIDLLITELDPGGAEKCLTELAIWLANAGHNPRVISLGKKPATDRCQLIEKLAEHHVPTEFLHASGPADIFRTRRNLARLIDQRCPDICQSFLFHANLFAAICYYRHAVPIVGGYRVADPRRIRHWLSRWAVGRMQAIVCVSDNVAKTAVRVESIPENKVHSIPNGIRVSNTEPRNTTRDDVRALLQGTSRSVGHDDPWLLFVGRLDLQKGVDRLIATSEQILQALPTHRLVLVGDGPERAALEASIENYSVRQRIHFVGWQPNPRDWMAASQLLLLPSRYEGMPNVVLEAMAESRPVLTTPAEGIDEMLGENGGAQMTDWGTWPERCIELALNIELCSSLGQLNRQRCEQHFQLNDQLARYLTLYESILGTV